jgi:hypothetical protein
VKFRDSQLGTVKKNSSRGKKLELGGGGASYRILAPTKSRLDWVKSKSLGESDSRSDRVSVATDINYKNTSIIVLNNSLLKDAIVIQLLTRLPEILLSFLHFHECFGSSEEAT